MLNMYSIYTPIVFIYLSRRRAAPFLLKCNQMYTSHLKMKRKLNKLVNLRESLMRRDEWYIIKSGVFASETWEKCQIVYLYRVQSTLNFQCTQFI